MENTKQIGTYAVLAAMVLLAIGGFAVAYADEGKGRDSDRKNHERIELRAEARGDFLDRLKNVFKLEIKAEADDSRVKIEDDTVHVKGATVTATSSSGFTATIATSSPIFTFNVETDASAKFEFKGMGRGSLANVAVGDVVNFRGLVLSGTTTSTLAVKATQVEGKTPHPRPVGTTTAATSVSATTSVATQHAIDAITRLIERLQSLVARLQVRL